MIDTKEQYENGRRLEADHPYQFPLSSDDAPFDAIRNAHETIEALREVARWANKCEPQFVGDAGDLLSDALDGLPDWLTDG